MMMKSTLVLFFAGLTCFASAMSKDQAYACATSHWSQIRDKYPDLSALPDRFQNSLGSLKQGNTLVANPNENEIRNVINRSSPEDIDLALDGVC